MLTLIPGAETQPLGSDKYMARTSVEVFSRILHLSTSWHPVCSPNLSSCGFLLKK